MKLSLPISIVAGVVSLMSTSAYADDKMTSATCQPLSSTNFEACCTANDWQEIILPGQYRYCKPLDANDKTSGRLGESVANIGNAKPVPGTDPQATGSIGNAGNPGNTKSVGGSGEQDKDNESPATGNNGASN